MFGFDSAARAPAAIETHAIAAKAAPHTREMSFIEASTPHETANIEKSASVKSTPSSRSLTAVMRSELLGDAQAQRRALEAIARLDLGEAVEVQRGPPRHVREAELPAHRMNAVA